MLVVWAFLLLRKIRTDGEVTRQNTEEILKKLGVTETPSEPPPSED